MLDVADVWSGHPVGFALLTTATRQYVAYYDTNRDLTVAQRALTSDTWTFTRLPTTVGWDSHNYIAMDIDGAGYIHVSGNMHTVPLIYFRSAQPNNAGTFSSATMIGNSESSCTYPLFFHDTAGNLVFNYRDGSSGSGNHIFNIYDTGTRAWRRLLNAPFTDGQTQRNAYPVGPVLGPDAFWHMVWVWRDTPDAETNHDLSYARSRDLVQWQTAAGTNLTLPITLATSDIVDPVPVNGGMINNNTKVGFDAQNRPIVAYHKFDSAGNTQLYNARYEGGRWVAHKTSSWSYRWAFSGQGTLVFQIQVEPVKVDAAGNLTQRWYHAQYGGWNAFALDPTTLAATAMLGRSLPYPASLETVQSTTAGMHVRWADDAGAGPDPAILYMLRWETLDSNRDMATSPIPPPDAAAPLRVQEVGAALLRRPDPELPDHLAHRPVRHTRAPRRLLAAAALAEQEADVALAKLHLGGRQRQALRAVVDGRQRRGPRHRRRARRRGPPQTSAAREQVSARARARPTCAGRERCA